MIRFLLDTDILSLSERGEPSIRRRILSLGANEFAASAVSAEEMMRGRLAVLARRTEGERRVHAYRKLVATIRFLHDMQLLDFDMACERKFNELRRQKIRIGTRDLRIAATALVHDLTLVTRNHKDFSRVPALRIEDWSGE
jgi:tRNA(fMet)-specific endonuclease VapC